MEPIANYVEDSILRTRQFTLFSDRLVLRISQQEKLVSEHIFLHIDTHPISMTIIHTDPEWKTGIQLTVYGSLICASVFFLGGMQFWHSFGPILSKIAIAVIAAGAILVFFGIAFIIAAEKNIEYRRFGSKACGTDMAFDIGRRGKQKNEFDAFLKALTECVEAAKIWVQMNLMPLIFMPPFSLQAASFQGLEAPSARKT